MVRIIPILLLIAVLSGFVLVKSPSLSTDQEWRSYGHDPGGMRFSPLRQIDRSNVSRLRRAWTFHTGEIDAYAPSTGNPPARSIESTPLVVEGILYFTTPYDHVFALDAETGDKIWEFDTGSGRKAERALLHNRGVAYWQGPAQDGRGLDQRILFGTAGGRLVALNARTGEPCRDFGERGAVHLRKGVADLWPNAEYSVTSPPVLYKDLVITGSQVQEYPSLGPSGAVRAYDVRTGKMVWKFDTVPAPGQMGHDTWTGFVEGPLRHERVVHDER